MDTERQIKTILYVVVMKEESDAVLHMHDFVLDKNFTNEYKNILESFVFNNKESGQKIIVMRPTIDPVHNTGLFGTEIAFFLAYVGIKNYSPDLVVSMGYAGDTGMTPEESLKHGTVVIAKEKGVYHRRQMLIKLYEKVSEGHYPLNNCEKLCKALGYESHPVGTSNAYVQHDQIATEKKIKVVEMELCSVARACAYFDVTCVGVKIISDCSTDNVDEKEREKVFLDNLMILRRKFNETFETLNKFLVNKKLSDL